MRWDKPPGAARGEEGRGNPEDAEARPEWLVAIVIVIMIVSSVDKEVWTEREEAVDVQLLKLLG